MTRVYLNSQPTSEQPPYHACTTNSLKNLPKIKSSKNSLTAAEHCDKHHYPTRSSPFPPSPSKRAFSSAIHSQSLPCPGLELSSHSLVDDSIRSQPRANTSPLNHRSSCAVQLAGLLSQAIDFNKQSTTTTTATATITFSN